MMNHWHWLALGITLIVLEMTTGGGFLLWIGIAAVITFVLSWLLPSLSLGVTITFFSVVSVVVSVAWWCYVRRHPKKSDVPHLNRRSQQYIGQVYKLDMAIENGRGKIKAGDSMWTVRGEDMPAGTSVRVVDSDGVTLVVEKAE